MVDPPRILIVDDERVVRQALLRQLHSTGYPAADAGSGCAALKRLESDDWDVVVTDLRMPSMDGLECLRQIKLRFPDVDVIIMTAFGSIETAVKAMKDGAADYLVKPFAFQELELRLTKLAQLRSMREELTQLRRALAETESPCGLIVRSTAMRRVWENIQLFADRAAPVLITGETGTGKELVARALHELSSRSQHPFVAVASGAIPQELAESELFGHEKGAFTGALQLHKGSFERAHRGTLLLDDVDDLPPQIQVKLLRVLQEGRLLRVGGNREVSVNVRIIATTKIDLAAAVAEGRIRKDLFYRLRGLEIHLPPLRERETELLVLAQKFLHELAAHDGTEPKALSTEAADHLSHHSWPGNVRELKRVMESASVLCRGSEIGPEHLPEYLRPRLRESGELLELNLGNASQVPFQKVVHRVESELIAWALKKAGGRQNQAAQLLDLPRTTLQAKLARRRN